MSREPQELNQQVNVAPALLSETPESDTLKWSSVKPFPR